MAPESISEAKNAMVMVFYHILCYYFGTYRMILPFALLWTFFELLIAYFAKTLDVYHEQFAYRFQLYHNNPLIPKFLISFANYDGAHYLHIAHDGYRQYQQVFFPLYPLVIHVLAPILNNQFFLTGFFLSNSCFLGGLYFFKKYLEAIGKTSKEIVWTCLFILLFPTSFFFHAVYTEGLFFFLVALALYLSQRRKLWLLGIVAVLAPLTRLVGMFLSLPLLATFFFEQKDSAMKTMKISQCIHLVAAKKRYALYSLLPCLGLGIYMLYLFFSAHDSLAFYHQQGLLNAGRSATRLIFLPQVYIRYIRIFITARQSITYFIALIEFLVFNMIFVTLCYDLWKLWTSQEKKKISLLGLSIFSCINLLLPTLTGTMTSIPRYGLLSLSFFVRIGQMKNVFLKIGLLILFFIFHIILLSLFIQGYFVG